MTLSAFVHTDCLRLGAPAKLFGSKIIYLPPRKGERYASALTNLTSGNSIVKRFGKINLKDFYKVTEIDEDEFFEKAKGESESLAGFILELAQALPKMGQVISFNSYQFVVESVDRKRIKRVKVILPKKV